jgi:hypothetical protein
MIEYHVARERNQVLVHAVTQINFEIIMLSEKKLVMKEHIVYDFIYMKSLEDESVEMESRFVVS